MIKARTYPDDHAIDVDFDAAPYLQDASTEDLQKLIACGFSGDYPADQVAIALADTNEQIAAMFTYIEARNRVARKPIGFEVHVDEDQPIAWIAQHRPEALAGLDLAEYDLAQCSDCGRIADRDTMSKTGKKDDLTCGACHEDEDDEDEVRACDICGYRLTDYAPTEVRCGACVNTYGDPVSGADPIYEPTPGGALTLRALQEMAERLIAEGADPDLPLAFDVSSASTTEGAALVTSASVATIDPKNDLPARELEHYDEADLQPYDAVLLQ